MLFSLTLRLCFFLLFNYLQATKSWSNGARIEPDTLFYESSAYPLHHSCGKGYKLTILEKGTNLPFLLLWSETGLVDITSTTECGLNVFKHFFDTLFMLCKRLAFDAGYCLLQISENTHLSLFARKPVIQQIFWWRGSILKHKTQDIFSLMVGKWRFCEI